MLDIHHNRPLTSHEQRKRDVSFLSQTFKPVSVPSSGSGLRLGLKDVPLDIFLCITRFLDVRHIIILRRVCKALAEATRLRAVWITVVNQHIIGKGLPWPSWAFPLTNVSTCTMEELSVRAARLVRWWDHENPLVELSPSRCLVRPENSVTWLSIYLSRWMAVQLNGALVEFWDLHSHSDATANIVFDGVEGVINGGKLLVDSANEYTLVVSTRSHQAHALRLLLPALGTSTPDPHIEPVRSWEGYSELLDASSTLWAFARGRNEQTATILHCLSGRCVTLVGTEPDLLLNVPGAIQISDQFVAVARRNTLDIYNMLTVLSALDDSVPIGSPVTISPSQSLAYPFGWIGSGLTFIAVRPPWLRQEVPRGDSIHLILTEDDLGTSVGLVAYNEEGPPGVTTEYKFEEPYYLLGGEAHCTVGVSWGTSARRMVYAVDTSDEIFLCGVSIPLDSTGLESRIPSMTRAVAEWPIPNGANDLPYHLVFEESSGVSAVAMASGRIWIMDPCVVVAGAEATGNTTDMDIPLHPDPLWPRTHPIPWPTNMNSSEDLMKDQDSIPGWSSSVERYFPGKNEQDCFGGASWFVNEILHIQGRADVVLFTIPDSVPYPTTELVHLDGRLIVIHRREGTGTHEAKLLPAGATVDAVKTHLRDGGSSELRGDKLAVDELLAHRYSAWRGRTEPNDVGYL